MCKMDERSLMEMAVDELWDLHKRTVAALALKLETQKSELDMRLARLQANAVLEQVVESSRRPYPTVTQKFRNPTQPEQTWSGRGKRPRWVTELLNAGMSIHDFQISEVAAP
jgi:DNA-binding protein H-NS